MDVLYISQEFNLLIYTLPTVPTLLKLPTPDWGSNFDKYLMIPNSHTAHTTHSWQTVFLLHYILHGSHSK
jgi:hypothetical protein